MGKWTLAHTEALCSEKFHTALQKPLSQSGLKLDEFFEAFDPQDPVVQKLIGALVNDIVLRRKSSTRTSCPTTRVSERCAEASFYINYRATDAHPSFTSHPPTRARSSTIRARRRNELYGIMGVPQASEMPWRTSYSSWSPDAEELIPDQPSPASVLGPYRSYPRPEPMPVEDATQPESESSGEYWWRAAMQGHTVGSAVSQSASPTPFIHDRSPSPHLPRSPRLPPGHGFVPWASARPPRRPTIVVEPELPPSNPRPVRVRSSSLPPASSEDIAAASSNLNPSIALREGESRSFVGTPHPESPPYSNVPIPGVEVTAVRSPDLAPYQPTNVEVFRFDQGKSRGRSSVLQLSTSVSRSASHMSVPYRQDLPPPGGFEAIKYKRNLPLKGPSGIVMLAGVTLFCGYGIYRVGQGNLEKRELKREKTWARIHLVPMLLAEGDRDAYRRQQAALEREKEIMKDVPGWEAGKSVYHDKKHVPRESIVVL